MANANGESSREARFSCEAARIKTAAIASVKPATKPRLSSPAGMARPAVRGLAASIPASAQRLKAIAAERAETMQTMIQTSLMAGGHPPAASIAPIMAKGSTNIECSHLIISSVVPIFRNRPKVRLPVLVYRERASHPSLNHPSDEDLSLGSRQPREGWAPTYLFSEGCPAIWRSLVTLKTPGTPLARMP